MLDKLRKNLGKTYAKLRKILRFFFVNWAIELLLQHKPA